MSNELSSTMRDYLVEIYRLSNKDKEFVNTADLADLLMVSAPAVNRMITKLKDIGLLIHEPYKGIKLTTQGEREALIKLRYQRIAEVFLVKVMGFEWHQVYDEADRISVGLSEVLASRMLAMAGNPTHCPHGDPIPNLNGTIPPLKDFPLTQAKKDDMLEICRVSIRESDRLEYIAALGLVPGVIIQLIHAAPFNGPLQLKLDDEFRIIGHNLAEIIHVKKVKTP